jgi:hypothetical protein
MSLRLKPRFSVKLGLRFNLHEIILAAFGFQGEHVHRYDSRR